MAKIIDLSWLLASVWKILDPPLNWKLFHTLGKSVPWQNNRFWHDIPGVSVFLQMSVSHREGVCWYRRSGIGNQVCITCSRFLICRELLLLLTVPRVISFICCLFFFLATNAGLSNNDKYTTATFDQISFIWRKRWIFGKLWPSENDTAIESLRRSGLVYCVLFLDHPVHAPSVDGNPFQCEIPDDLGCHLKVKLALHQVPLTNSSVTTNTQCIQQILFLWGNSCIWHQTDF